VELLGGFFVEDDTGDELFDAWGSEEHVSVLSSVFSIVLEIDTLEFLLH